MSFYDQSIIEQVRDANDIVEVIGQYVKLDKKGANHFGLCPFHGEKTPSFSVNGRKQIFFCFGCHKGGDVISFLMEYDRLTYPQAIEALAKRANISLPEKKISEGAKLWKQKKERLLEINKEAAIYYHDLLMLPQGAAGYKYLTEGRKLGKGTLVHFGLGYSGKGGELYRVLKDKGFNDEELKESGLFTITENKVREKFFNRVMFPIMDINNRVIGFGGRVMGDFLPKYLNSPETMIFNKSNVLYGINFARKTKENYILLCEGYMDVISLHQAGFTNSVASLGTSFTPQHAMLLKRYTDTVVLTQDSDAAGTAAKIRSFPVLHDAGLKVKVITMGAFKDPDEYIKANGAQSFKELADNAGNAFLYIISVIKSGYDLSDPDAVTEFYNEAARNLTVFKDPVERDNYIKSVCREHFIDYESLKALTERKMQDPRAAVSEIPREEIRDKKALPEETVTGRAIDSQNILLYYMSGDEDLRKKVFSFLSPGDFTGISRQRLAQELSECMGVFDARAFITRLEEDSDTAAEAAGILMGPEVQYPEDELHRLLSDSIKNIRLSSIDREMSKPDVKMNRLQELMKERNELKRRQI